MQRTYQPYMAATSKPPTFNGEENVDGFMSAFEMWAELHNMTGRQLHSALVSALREGAREFAYNVDYNGKPTYQKLRAALIENYGDSAMRHYY